MTESPVNFDCVILTGRYCTSTSWIMAAFPSAHSELPCKLYSIIWNKPWIFHIMWDEWSKPASLSPCRLHSGPFVLSSRLDTRCDSTQKLLFRDIAYLVSTSQLTLDKIDVFEFLKQMGTWKNSSIAVIVSTVFSGYNDTFKVYWTYGHVSTELCNEGLRFVFTANQ